MNFDNGNLSVEVARVKIESWCAYQDRCTFEVVNKLTSFGLDESQISSLIIHLTETQFLNELRFTESFISGKIIDTNSPTDWSLKIIKNASSQTDDINTKKKKLFCCF